VDESGNQIAVFGRRGARPFNLVEMERMYKINGKLFTVPEIKADSDIRSFYGEPRDLSNMDRAGASPSEPSVSGQDQEAVSSDDRGVAQDAGGSAPSSEKPEPKKQSHRWLDLLTFGFPLLPLGFVLCLKLSDGEEPRSKGKRLRFRRRA